MTGDWDIYFTLIHAYMVWEHQNVTHLENVLKINNKLYHHFYLYFCFTEWKRFPFYTCMNIKCTSDFPKNVYVERDCLIFIPTDFNFLCRLSDSFCFLKTWPLNSVKNLDHCTTFTPNTLGWSMSHTGIQNKILHIKFYNLDLSFSKLV